MKEKIPINDSNGPKMRNVENSSLEFPGGPVVRTSQFHSHGPAVQSLVRELRSHRLHSTAKKTKKERVR